LLCVPPSQTQIPTEDTIDQFFREHIVNGFRGNPNQTDCFDDDLASWAGTAAPFNRMINQWVVQHVSTIELLTSQADEVKALAAKAKAEATARLLQAENEKKEKEAEMARVKKAKLDVASHDLAAVANKWDVDTEVIEAAPSFAALVSSVESNPEFLAQPGTWSQGSQPSSPPSAQSTDMPDLISESESDCSDAEDFSDMPDLIDMRPHFPPSFILDRHCIAATILPPPPSAQRRRGEGFARHVLHMALFLTDGDFSDMPDLISESESDGCDDGDCSDMPDLISESESDCSDTEDFSDMPDLIDMRPSFRFTVCASEECEEVMVPSAHSALCDECRRH
jgi:hypothetical protein